jgi:hypothetical protein
MKNTILPFSLFASLFLIVLIVNSSCKKSNNSNSTGTTSATVSGTAYQSSISSGVDITSGNTFDLITAQTKGGDSLIMEFTFPDTVAVNKAYPLGGSQTAASLSYTDWKTQDWFSTGWNAPSGTLTITSLNKSSHNVQGNFSAIVWKAGGDSLIIKNGQFNFNYQVQ